MFFIEIIEVFVWEKGRNGGSGNPHISVIRPNKLPKPILADGIVSIYNQDEDQESGNRKGGLAPGGDQKSGGPTSSNREDISKHSAKGGRRKKYWTQMAKRLGVDGTPITKGEFAPYKRAAAAFHKQTLEYLADQVGGGYAGPDVGAILASASIQLARARFFQYKAELEADPKKQLNYLHHAMAQENSSRQNLLAAFELCAKHAHKTQKKINPHIALAKALSKDIE